MRLSDNHAFLLEGWQDLYQHIKDDERQDHQGHGWYQPLARNKSHFVSRVPEKALGKELSADHHVPPHRKNSHNRQNSGGRVNPSAHSNGKSENLRQAKQRQRCQRSQEDLNQNLRKEKPRVHHEIQAAERFIGFVDAVNEVQHLQREIDDKRIEKVFGNGVQATHINGHTA